MPTLPPQNGFRWASYGISDVSVDISLSITLGVMALCLTGIACIFHTGYRLKA